MRLHWKHKWNVSTAEARKIQEDLRGKWVGEDRLAEIRTVAGLDAAFVLTGSQALKAMRSRWEALREANRAIGAALRTRAGVKPVYVSQGHRVSLEAALRLTLSVCDSRRIPRPTRDADQYVSEVKRQSGAASDSNSNRLAEQASRRRG